MKTLKILLVASVLFNFSCLEKKAEEVASLVPTVPSDGSQTVAQIAGSGQYCEAIPGFQGANRAISRSLTLNADNTFSYVVYFSDRTTCSTGQTAGGSNTATVAVAGAWTVGGTNTTPSTGTKIAFVVGSTNMWIYADHPEGSALASWINTNCSGTLNYNTSAYSSRTLNGNTCTGNGTFDATTFPAVNEALSNTAFFDGSSLQIGLSTSEDVWRPGGSSFPTAYSRTYLYW